MKKKKKKVWVLHNSQHALIGAYASIYAIIEWGCSFPATKGKVEIYRISKNHYKFSLGDDSDQYFYNAYRIEVK